MFKNIIDPSFIISASVNNEKLLQWKAEPTVVQNITYLQFLCTHMV